MAADDLSKLISDVADLQRRLAGVMRVGSVHEVMTGKGEQKIRVVTGKDKDGKDVISPWLFTGDHRGGASTERKYCEGQNVILLSPNGDFRQANILPWAEANDRKRPDHATEDHETYQFDRLRRTYGQDFQETWLSKKKDSTDSEDSVVLIRHGNKPTSTSKAGERNKGPKEKKGDPKGKHYVRTTESILHQVGTSTSTRLISPSKITDKTIDVITKQILSGSNPTPPINGESAAAEPVNSVGSSLSGMTAQLQSLVSEGVGLPGIQNIGSQISGMASAITGAGGSSSIASSITSLGSQISSSAMNGMTTLISSLQGQMSSLMSMLNPTGSMAQVLHETILDKAKGIIHSVFQGQHLVKLHQGGIDLTTIENITKTAKKILNNGMVFNSDSHFTTGMDYASAHPIGSDVRLKTNIENHSSVLDRVMALQLKTFNIKKADWKTGEIFHESERSSFGLVAQDVQRLFPEIVHGDKLLAIEESKIGLLLLSAFQEFVTETRKQIEDLKNRTTETLTKGDFDA